MILHIIETLSRAHPYPLLCVAAITGALLEERRQQWEVKAGLWRVSGRRSPREAWQDWQTKRELRRHLRATYRKARAATVAGLGVEQRQRVVRAARKVSP